MIETLSRTRAHGDDAQMRRDCDVADPEVRHVLSAEQRRRGAEVPGSVAGGVRSAECCASPHARSTHSAATTIVSKLRVPGIASYLAE